MSQAAPAGGGRVLLHPAAVSSFSRWHRSTMPGDRALTDLDGLVFRNRRLEALLEHRTAGYPGTAADNRSLEAVRRLAWHLGLGFSVVDAWRDGMVDTRFAVWLAYQRHPALRLLAAHEMRGNFSPVTGKPVAVPAEAAVLLAAHCTAFEIPWRSIDVRPDTGTPVRPNDVRWLVELPTRVPAR